MRRSWREQKPSSLFRGTDALRLLSGLFMLVVVAMMIYRARDPNLWTWLAPNNTSQVAEGKAGERTASSPTVLSKTGDAEAQPSPQKTADNESKTSETSQKHREDSHEPESPLGPTDLDPDEAQEAAMEFQAVTDGTLELQREEMVPYDRLVRWVETQSFEEMLKRAQTDLVFTRLYLSPDQYRGQLVAFDLNIRQIIDAGKNDEGVHLWEVRGWTTEAKAWLYWTIVVDLPKGMPVGPEVYEKAKFVGYFFKLQGYHEAGAKPNAPALKAPLLIGRLRWRPVPIRQVSNTSNSELIWGIGLVVILGGIFLILHIIRKRSARNIRTGSVSTTQAANISQWLEHPKMNSTPDTSPSINEHVSQNESPPMIEGPEDSGQSLHQLDEESP